MSGQVRVGDRERAAAADRLAAHAAAGRLDTEELEARLERAGAAVVADDLAALEADLPRPPVRTARAPGWAPAVLLAAAVALVVVPVAAVGHPVGLPLLLLALLALRCGAPLRRSRS